MDHKSPLEPLFRCDYRNKQIHDLILKQCQQKIQDLTSKYVNFRDLSTIKENIINMKSNEYWTIEKDKDMTSTFFGNPNFGKKIMCHNIKNTRRQRSIRIISNLSYNE